MIPSDDPLTLSLLFHLNSEPWLDEDAYRSASYQQEFKQIEGVRIRAPLPNPRASPLLELVRRRKSARTFSEQTMSSETVSTLISACYGAVATECLDGGGAFLRRSVPSGGGLYPLEIYSFIQRVTALDDGLYHYDVRGHSLEQVRLGNQTSGLKPIFYTYPFVHNANLIVCLAAVFPRTQKKYGPRGYRYILLEAGHAAQNLCLCAAELELGSLCMGGFVDTGLNRLLALDATTEGVVYGVPVGNVR